MTELPTVPWDGDLMNRRPAANFLQAFLDQNRNVKVLNIDSPWGSGKTFFISNWHRELHQTRVSVYFNAWEADYTGDPFVSLAANIKEQLAEQSNNATAKKFGAFAKSAAKTLVGAVPAVTKGLIKKFSGVDCDEAAAAGAALDSAEKLAEQAVEGLINSNKEVTAQVQAFKVQLAELSLEVLKEKMRVEGDDLVPPVYIFIDELDRCRPTYAVELLERVKHFFAVDNCVFVVATDTRQLKHSIKAVYGAEFDSERYLKRFFDVDFSLDNSDIARWICTNLSEFSVACEFVRVRPISESAIRFDGEFPRVMPSDKACINRGEVELNSCQMAFFVIAKSFAFELRDLESLKFRVISVLASSRSQDFDFFWVCYLCALKHYSSECYELFVEGKEGFDTKSLPDFQIYTGFENISPHAVAKLYRDLILLSQPQLMDRSNSAPRGDLSSNIATKILVSGGYKKYYSLVQLAGQVSA